MSEEILERTDPQEATVPEEVTPVEETQPEPEAEPDGGEKQPSSQDEPEVEIEGEKVKVSQLKEWREAAENREKWQKSNTQKAQEIASERKRLAEAEAIYNVLQKDPQKLQKILAPEPERNFDAEWMQIQKERPTEDPQAYFAWEQKKDQFLMERAAEVASQKARQEAAQETAQKFNNELVGSAYEKYKGEVDDDGFTTMTQWVKDNLRPSQGGAYPKTSYDIAFSVLYGDKTVTKAKLEAAKSVAKSIEKAKPASGDTGKLKQPDKEPLDDDDAAFADEVHARHKPIKR
jgi:hypothetical protein